MTDGSWPEGIEPTQAMTEASGWLSRLIDDPSDENLARCKTWFGAAEGHRKAFASVMFSISLPDELRSRIESELGTRFPSLHTPAAASTNLVHSPWGPRGAPRSGQPLRSRQRRLALVGVATASVAAAVLVVNFAPQLLSGSFFSPAHAETLQTGHGMIRSFALSDGSNVTLDADTRVEVSIDRTRRHASLRHGRARFRLHADSRPFTIDAGSGQIVSTSGTVDISLEGNRRVNVELRSGTAEAREAASAASGTEKARQLMVDQPITYSVVNFVPQTIATPIADTRNWPDGWVSYRTIALADLIGEANRYAKKPIILDDSTLDQLAASGRFKLTDTEGFVSRIAELFELAVSHQPDGIHLDHK